MTRESEKEFLDHVELRADHYISVIGGKWNDDDRNPVSAQERFRNLISPWLIKGLITRNKQLWALKAALRQVGRAETLEDAKERADDALSMLDGMEVPALREGKKP